MNIVNNYHKELLGFKDLHNGEVCYIFGSGKSLVDFKVQEQGIYIGCNHIIKNKSIKDNLKYYFFGHGYLEYTDDTHPIYGNHKKEVDNLDINIKKFAMVSRDNNLEVHKFTVNDVKILHKINATPCDINLDHIHKDLECNSFLNHSIIFPSIQFAMYAGFKRIYLVGCDCNGYFHSNNFLGQTTSNSIDNDLVYWWKKMYEFKNKHYNDCKIISINPVGLVGIMDDDIFTK